MKEELINVLNNELIWTDELIRQMTALLEKAPPGELQIFKHHSNYQYYQKLPGHRNYISKKKPELAIRLAQKEYDEAVLALSRNLQSHLTSLWHTLQESNFVEIISSFPEEKRKLINSYFLSDDDFIKNWESQPYQGKPIDESTPEIFTNKGEQVRSKSEKIIADKLADMGIPYRYEAPLLLGSMGIIYPDFTILKISTREDIYLEHFGMLDDQSYCHNACNKLHQFIRNGYISGKNLLITFETSSIPLNTRNLEIQLRAILDL